MVKQLIGLKQVQSLKLNQQLQKALNLLTMTHNEVASEIAKEMSENPLLEDNVSEDIICDIESRHNEEIIEIQNKEIDASTLNQSLVVGGSNFDWQDYINGDDILKLEEKITNFSNNKSRDYITNFDDISDNKEQLLSNYLHWQFSMEDLKEDERAFGNFIINNINEDGYLIASFNELLKLYKIDRNKALKVIDIIKGLDPVGCGCDNLTDSLLVQANIKGVNSDLMQNIIKYHLNDICKNNIDSISKKLNVNKSQLLICRNDLKELYLKPGRLFSSQTTNYIVPDIYLLDMGDSFIIKINNDGVPDLHISNTYKSILNDKSVDKKTNKYVREKLKAANFLIKSIRTRQTTIYKVATAIVNKQREFFRKGINYFKPMILKDIANETGLHESTVSRVTNNKYIHTPMGLFELKYFFNSSKINSVTGISDISDKILMARIKDLIAKEDLSKPFSDQKISELLTKYNIKVSRRTVTKYREQLGYSSSFLRKNVS